MKYLVILFFFTSISMTTPPNSYLLVVNFDGLESNKGQILMKIVNAKNEKIGGYKLNINNKKASVSINLKKGEYAISAFHDANKDEKLNTNAVGIPNEDYGFSNNARGWFGPPDLSDQMITLHSNKEISITLE